MTNLLIDSQYFYNVDAYKILYKASHIEIDIYENFRKMSFRNRCRIVGANGIIELTIPLEGGRDQRSMMKDLKISYREDWRRKHWRAIFSAYGRSPWFEYFRDDLLRFFDEKPVYLVEWNTMIFEWTNQKIGRPLPVNFTSTYQEAAEGFLDLRHAFMPKNSRENNPEKLPKYHQVFEQKFGFIPRLSILDLLCCEGPGAAGILAGSV